VLTTLKLGGGLGGDVSAGESMGDGSREGMGMGDYGVDGAEMRLVVVIREDEPCL